MLDEDDVMGEHLINEVMTMMQDPKNVHALCDDCWGKSGAGFDPDRVDPLQRKLTYCCWCRKETCSGIFVLSNPSEFKCRGVHV